MRVVRQHGSLVSERLAYVSCPSVVAVETPKVRLARLCPVVACSRRRRSSWRKLNAWIGVIEVRARRLQATLVYPSPEPHPNLPASSHGPSTSKHPPDGRWRLLEFQNPLPFSFHHLSHDHAFVQSSTVCWHSQIRPQLRTISSLKSHWHIAISSPPTVPPSSSSLFCRSRATLENSWHAMIR